MVDLSPETRRRKVLGFGGIENVPERAITVEIRPIMWFGSKAQPVRGPSRGRYRPRSRPRCYSSTRGLR